MSFFEAPTLLMHLSLPAAWQGAEQTYRQTMEKSLRRSAGSATWPPISFPIPVPAGETITL